MRIILAASTNISSCLCLFSFSCRSGDFVSDSKLLFIELLVESMLKWSIHRYLCFVAPARILSLYLQGLYPLDPGREAQG